MGKVYLGQSRTGRRLAIKMLSEQYAEDPEYRERFAREVAAAKLVSPLYTAAVVDADPQAKAPWLATTFIDGPSLEEWVTKHGALPAGKVLALAAGLAEALISIHNVGLVHRDLKPSNVIINPNGPHIIDFGIALAGDDTRITTSLMVGTPSYMAPERVNGLDAGPSGDIFSLGATLFYAATATQLVSGGSFYEQIIQVALGQFDLTEVPKECRPIIDLCLSQAPQDRPTSDELMRVLIGLGVQQPEAGWWPDLEVKPLVSSPTPHPSRRRILVGASAFGVLLIGGGVSAVAYRLRRNAAPAAGPDSSGQSSSPAPESTPPGERGRVLWQVASGAGNRQGGPDSSAMRVIIHRGSRIISAAGATVLASDTTERRVWTKNLPTSAVRLWQWGDAVIAADLRKLWLFDAQTGDERFAVDIAALEERNTGDNPDRLAVQIDRILVGEDRAFVGLGTATVAIDRTGQSTWRVARSFGEGGRRTPPPLPFVANGAHVVSRESGSSPRLTMRRVGNGSLVWQLPDTFAKRGQQPPPPPGPGEGGHDEAWPRIEGRIAGDSIVLRDGPEIEVRSLNTGKLLWHYTSQTPIAGMEVVGDRVLVAADRLVARRIATGEPSWELPVRGARVAVAGEALAVMHETGLSYLDSVGRAVWDEPFPPGLQKTMLDRLVVHDHTAYVIFRPKGAPGPGGPGDPGPPPGTRAPVDVVAFRL